MRRMREGFPDSGSSPTNPHNSNLSEYTSGETVKRLCTSTVFAFSRTPRRQIDSEPATSRDTREEITRSNGSPASCLAPVRSPVGGGARNGLPRGFGTVQWEPSAVARASGRGVPSKTASRLACGYEVIGNTCQSTVRINGGSVQKETLPGSDVYAVQELRGDGRRGRSGSVTAYLRGPKSKTFADFY